MNFLALTAVLWVGRECLKATVLSLNQILGPIPRRSVPEDWHGAREPTSPQGQAGLLQGPTKNHLCTACG